MHKRLPKPAKASGRERSPLICRWPERLLYIGRLGMDVPHRHAAAVCLVALEGGLRVRLPPALDWREGRSAVLPAGCLHVLDARDALTAVFYSDAHRPHYRLMSAREQTEPAFGLRNEKNLIKALANLHRHAPQAGAALPEAERALDQSLAAFTQAPAIDTRILRTVARMQRDLTRNDPLEALAEAVNLSPGRLQHLFLAETGVPLRRYRIWLRFRAALEWIAANADLTKAALAVGFASSAHFSHAFKAMFGVSASSVLAGKLRPRILFIPR